MRILVTGGGGFLGSELVAELIKVPNNEVYIFDSYAHGYPAKLSKRKNLKAYTVGNIKDLSAVSRVVEKAQPDVVVHLAAHITRPESIGEFRLCGAVNYVGTANLLEACLRDRYKPKRIIFASSGAVYNPTSHYGIAKQAAEALLESICPLANIKLAILRFSEIYGYSKSPTSKSLVNFLVDNMLVDQSIAVFDVDKKQDYVHVSDAVRACKLAIKSSRPVVKVDIGSGVGVVTKDLISKLKTMIKFEGQFRYLTDVPGVRIVDHVADTVPAKEQLGFECKADFGKELKSLVTKRRKDLR